MEDEDFIAFDMEDEPEEAETSQHDALPTQSHVPVSVDDTIREHAAARSTPWALHVPWHKCRNVAEMYVDETTTDSRLHEEIKTYSSWICPTREEHAVRVMVIELLQNALCSEWPDAQVLSFGSQDTQLYLPQGYVRRPLTVAISTWWCYRRRWMRVLVKLRCVALLHAYAPINWRRIFR